jgi:hypothetical protein
LADLASRVVIVGAGHAGGSVAALLRQYGHTGPIDLIGDLAKARSASPALRRGLTQVRAFEEAASGLLAVERHDPATGQRVLLAFNTGNSPLSQDIEVSYRTTGIAPLLGDCAKGLAAPGTVRIALPAFGFAACILETDD